MSESSNPHLAGGSLARRARAFENSPWSAASDLISGHPDSIYFGNGAPAEELQPLERLQWAAQQAWADAGSALAYGELAGYEPLRELIVERMHQRGIDSDINHVMITSGSQQGIDLIAKLMLDPGDTIVVEGPTYLGAMQTFDAYEAEYLVCPVDDEGVRVDLLESMLESCERPPKLMYTIPAFQNPTGHSLSSGRRAALLELADRFGMLVVEDDPYGELYFDQPPDPPLRAAEPRVVYLGTFSKTIAPGIRVGWMVAEDHMMNLLLMAKEGADVHGNRVVTRTVFHAANGFLDDHVDMLRRKYRSRRDALVETLDDVMPKSVDYLAPGGGFFLWCDLPVEYDAQDLLEQSAKSGVAFLPGAWFFPKGSQRSNGFRLSYSSLPEERIVLGATRLGEVTRRFLER